MNDMMLSVVGTMTDSIGDLGVLEGAIPPINRQPSKKHSKMYEGEGEEQASVDYKHAIVTENDDDGESEFGSKYVDGELKAIQSPVKEEQQRRKKKRKSNAIESPSNERKKSKRKKSA